MAPGVTLNPGTPVARLEIGGALADNLLCMSVNPGWGGQPFIPASLDRADRALRALARPGPGSRSTAASARRPSRTAARAGANRFTAGSAIFSAPDPAAAYHDLVDACARRGRPRGPEPADEAYLARHARAGRARPRRRAPNPHGRLRAGPRRRGRRRGIPRAAGARHAEIAALRRGRRPRAARRPTSASSRARTTGRTPPCADALIAAGVVRVVGAARDPFRGRRRRLRAAARAAGVEVDVVDPAATRPSPRGASCRLPDRRRLAGRT